MEAQIRMINVDQLVPNKAQPRTQFDTSSLQELASSIRSHGIVQPLIVRRLQDKFEIIAGERRLKAAELLGLQSVPCIICDIDDNESSELALVENIHRKDLTPIDEARGYKKLLDKGYITIDQLAARMGTTQSNLNDKIRLLSLDEAVQDALQKNMISVKHAKSLLRLTDKMKQVDILNEIIRDKLTVRQVEDEIDKVLGTYKKEENLTGGINIDSRNDIDVSNLLLEDDDFNLSITPKEYQYRSKINDKNTKKSLFFNNLENHPATMEDPTLSFGFDPMKTQNIISDEDFVDLEDQQTDDELDIPIQGSEAAQQEEEKKINMDVYTPRELTKAINELVKLAIENNIEVKTEEFNFSDIYQIVVKIVKNPEEEQKEENK
jgi:ParB family chromosome partitioning protein